MPPFRRLLITLLGGLFLFVSLGAWAFASPVGASPDEDFHLASIWCGNGERAGLCEAGATEDERLVPDKILTSTCFAFDAAKKPSCQGDEFDEVGYGMAATKRLNAGNQYPSGYFWVMSFLASDNIVVSTLLIRLVNSLIFAVIATVTWVVLPRNLRVVLVASIAVTYVPLGLFIAASPNPSSWAMLSTAILFPALLGFLSSRGRRQLALGLLAGVATLLGVNSRGDSAAYAIVAAAAAVALTLRRDRHYLWSIALPAALVLIAAVAFLNAGQTSLALDGDSTAREASRLGLVVSNFLQLPMLWAGIFGLVWGLGWLDTPMHAMVWGTSMFAFSGLVFAMLRWQGWRKSLAICGTALAVVVLPLYILYTMNTVVGDEVQPRYVLPLITLFVAVVVAPSVHSAADSGLAPQPPRLNLSWVQIWTLVALLSFSQAIALYDNIQRYTGPGAFKPVVDVEWWWEGLPSPLWFWLAGSLAFAALLSMFARAALKGPSVETDCAYTSVSATEQATKSNSAP